MTDLAPYAVTESNFRGRRVQEPAPVARGEFQRDRDRIVHCTAFRRLEYKTQVFVNHEGDLFRTRLTHSIEVAQITRSIARALHLNEDLAEAVALSHDLGHTPFGHAGQEALNTCMKDFGGFEHNLQSLRSAPHPRNSNAQNALTWLKEQDDSLYYVNIGGNKILWDWMAYAYELELPVLNFRYNRRVLTSDEQNGAASPFNAQPKYILAGQDLPQPPNSQLLSNFQGVNIWYQPDVLPYAFSTQNVNGQITRPLVTEQPVRLNGPNQVIVTGRAEASDEHLVVLVSDYPG